MRTSGLAALAFALCSSAVSAQTMSITSSSFPAGGAIPLKYTCDAGMGSPNPALAFAGAPAKAQSLVLLMDDPDVPKTLVPSGEFMHWMVWDLPPDSTGIAEGEGKSGVNGLGRAGYMGPCPTDRTHRYFFKLYALDTKITTPLKTKTDLMKAMQGHVLEQAELMATYERVKK